MIISFKSELYPLIFHFCLGNLSDIDSVPFMEEEDKQSAIELSSSVGSGCVVHRSGVVCVVVHGEIESPIGYGLLSHEIFHAVEYSFEWLGIKHGKKSSEAYAYMIQFVTEKVFHGLNQRHKYL